MTFHAKVNSLMKELIRTKGIEKGENAKLLVEDGPNQFEQQQNVLNLLIHTCDISHNSKPFDISYIWTYRLMDEFWRQGDTEQKMGLPISFLCDRKTTDVPKSQIGFIKGIIIPTFDLVIEIFPTISPLLDNVNNNLEKWADLSEKSNEEDKKSRK
jgi:hypothetical protein